MELAAGRVARGVGRAAAGRFSPAGGAARPRATGGETRGIRRVARAIEGRAVAVVGATPTAAASLAGVLLLVRAWGDRARAATVAEPPTAGLSRTARVSRIVAAGMGRSQAIALVRWLHRAPGNLGAAGGGGTRGAIRGGRRAHALKLAAVTCRAVEAAGSAVARRSIHVAAVPRPALAGCSAGAHPTGTEGSARRASSAAAPATTSARARSAATSRSAR
jgi:hypothetical protein